MRFLNSRGGGFEILGVKFERGVVDEVSKFERGGRIRDFGSTIRGGGVVDEVSKFEGGRIRHFPALGFAFHRISDFFLSLHVFLLSFF